MNNQQSTKWYDNTSTVILLCIFLFPIGLYALWKNQSISKGIKIGVTAFFVLIFFAVLSNKNKTENTQNNDVQKYSNYQQSIIEKQNQLLPAKLKERDSIISLMQNNDAYKKLVVDKSVDIQYLALLNALSEVITSANGEGVEITESTHNECSKISGGVELMKSFIGFEFRGGIPIEFAEVTDRFIDKYRIAGNKGDLIVDANGNKSNVPFDYNLSILKAVFNAENKEALDEIGKAYQSGFFTWRDENKNDGTYHYPQYIFKKDWIAYLKQNYPNTAYIPNYDYELTATELYQEYSANEVTADEKYKGKRIAVTGVVEEIAKDIMDKPYISLSKQDAILSAVQCFVSKEIASKVSKGQTITLTGTCNGSVLTVVILKDCVLE